MIELLAYWSEVNLSSDFTGLFQNKITKIVSFNHNNNNRFNNSSWLLFEHLLCAKYYEVLTRVISFNFTKYPRFTDEELEA